MSVSSTPTLYNDAVCHLVLVLLRPFLLLNIISSLSSIFPSFLQSTNQTLNLPLTSPTRLHFPSPPSPSAHALSLRLHPHQAEYLCESSAAGSVSRVGHNDDVVKMTRPLAAPSCVQLPMVEALAEGRKDGRRKGRRMGCMRKKREAEKEERGVHKEIRRRKK